MDQKEAPHGKVLTLGFISCGGLIFYNHTKNNPAEVFTLAYLQHITGKPDYRGFSVKF